MSLNNMVLLIGYVGQDVRVQKNTDGTKKVVLRIATHEPDANKAGTQQWLTTWHDVVAWDEIASLAERSFVKGSRIRVNGRICYHTYPDKTGHIRYVTEIKAEYIQNLDR